MIKIHWWQLWKRYIIGLFNNEREPFFIGYSPLYKNDLNDPKTDSVEDKLILIGYQPDYFSFNDRDQITSMRKVLVKIVDGNRVWMQFHVRVFSDGEVRGHYEYSFEESALEHLQGKITEEINEIDLGDIKKVLEIA